MKNIKVLLFVFAAFYMVTGLFARDVETHSVENLKSWQDSKMRYLVNTKILQV